MSSLLRGQFKQVEAVSELEEGTWYHARLSSGAPVDIAVITRPASELTERLAAIAKARHPNLPELREVLDLEDGAKGAVFAAARGRSVAERIEQGSGTVAEAIDWACRMGEAIAVLHEAGVVHGDIEPEWVRLVPGRGPMLTGLVLNRREGRKRGVGAAFGNTLRYVPPEQLEGEVTEKGDIFSVGAVLYHALTGRGPFDAPVGEDGSSASDDVEALRQRIMHGKITPLAELRVDLRGVMAYAVDRALQTDPSRRFPNAEAFRKALRSALVVAPMMGRRPLSAPPTPASEKKKSPSLVEDETGSPVDPDVVQLRSLPPPVPPSSPVQRKRGSIPPPAARPSAPRVEPPPLSRPTGTSARSAKKTQISGGVAKPNVTPPPLSASQRLSLDQLDFPDVEPLDSPADTEEEVVSPAPLPEERTQMADVNAMSRARKKPAAAAAGRVSAGATAPKEARAKRRAEAEPSIEQPVAEQKPETAVADTPSGETTDSTNGEIRKGRRRRTASWVPPSPSRHRDAGGPPRGVVGQEPVAREPTLRMAFGSERAERLDSADTSPGVSHRVSDFPAGVAQAFGHVETKPLPSMESEAPAPAASARVKSSKKSSGAKGDSKRTLAGYAAPEVVDTDEQDMGPPDLDALMDEDTEILSLDPEFASEIRAEARNEGAAPLDPMSLDPVQSSSDEDDIIELGADADDAEDQAAAIALTQRKSSVPPARPMPVSPSPIPPTRSDAAVTNPVVPSPRPSMVDTEEVSLPTIRLKRRKPAMPAVLAYALGGLIFVAGVLVGVLLFKYVSQPRGLADVQVGKSGNLDGIRRVPDDDYARIASRPVDEAPAVANIEESAEDEPPRFVTLRGLPAEAEVRVDGQAIEGHEIVLDGTPRTVEVAAEGFAPWSVGIDGEHEQSFVVDLMPIEELAAANEAAQPEVLEPVAARPTAPQRPRGTAPSAQRRAEARLRAEAARLEALRQQRPTAMRPPPRRPTMQAVRRPSVVRDPGF